VGQNEKGSKKEGKIVGEERQLKVDRSERTTEKEKAGKKGKKKKKTKKGSQGEKPPEKRNLKGSSSRNLTQSGWTSSGMTQGPLSKKNTRKRKRNLTQISASIGRKTETTGLYIRASRARTWTSGTGRRRRKNGSSSRTERHGKKEGTTVVTPNRNREKKYAPRQGQKGYWSGGYLSGEGEGTGKEICEEDKKQEKITAGNESDTKDSRGRRYPFPTHKVPSRKGNKQGHSARERVGKMSHERLNQDVQARQKADQKSTKRTIVS